MYTDIERAEKLFTVAVLPRLCKYHNCTVIEHTDKRETIVFDDGKVAVHNEHFHYETPKWCSTYIYDNNEVVNNFADRFDTRFVPRHHEEVMFVTTKNGSYRLYADSVLVRYDQNDKCVETFILHLLRTEFPQRFNRWRPYVRGHGGNNGWAGYLNTDPVIELRSSIESVSDLLYR